ncbi:MAG TPA: hypothetical protein DCL74_03390 [Succinivibrionaceae bacterium]|nr:hypothetical protein [Succinivibrionaceae bacterium]
MITDQQRILKVMKRVKKGWRQPQIEDTCACDMTNYKECSASTVFGKTFYSLDFVRHKGSFDASCKIYASAFVESEPYVCYRASLPAERVTAFFKWLFFYA